MQGVSGRPRAAHGTQQQSHCRRLSRVCCVWLSAALTGTCLAAPYLSKSTHLLAAITNLPLSFLC